MLGVVNFIKVLSIVLFLIILVLVYAYLPVMIQITPDVGVSLHKEDFFYFSMGFFVVVNLFLLGFQKIMEPRLASMDLKVWIRGLGFVLNVYFTLIVGFIGVFNNQAHLDPGGFSYLNYFGPFLIFSWVIGLIYLLYKEPKTS